MMKGREINPNSAVIVSNDWRKHFTGELHYQEVLQDHISSETPLITVSESTDTGLTVFNDVYLTNGAIRVIGSTGVYTQAFHGYKQVSVSGRTDGSISIPLGWSNGEKGHQNWVKYEFMTDAPVLELRISNGVSDNRIKLMVNDEYINNAEYLENTGRYCLIDFNTRLMRKITVEVPQGAALFKGVKVDATSVVLATQSNDLKVAYVADSFGFGVGMADPIMTWPVLISKHFRLKEVLVNAHGGTGFLNNANGTKYTFEERAEDLIEFNPDVVFVSGSINDRYYSLPNGDGTLFGAVVSYVNRLRELFPSVIIIIMGVPAVKDYLGIPTPSGEDQPVDVELVLKSVVESLNKDYVHFVPCQIGQVPIIFGSGDSGTTLGDGNADYYRESGGSHFTESGQVVWAQVMASRIKNLACQK